VLAQVSAKKTAGFPAVFLLLNGTDVTRRLRPACNSHHEGYQEDNQEKEKQNFRDTSGCGRNTAKAQNRSHNRDQKED
jgi:hypothetical protein